MTNKQAKARIDIDALRDALPHGSGIDCNWTFSENKDGSVRCSNAWHAMNEHGYYCGYIPFTFTVRVASSPEAGKGPVLVAGPVRGGFKRASRASLYLDDVADMIGQNVDHALESAGRALVVVQDAPRELCGQCGEYWPCSDSKRTDIRPDIRALHARSTEGGAS